METHSHSLVALLDELTDGELVVLYRRMQATYIPQLPVLHQLHGMRSILEQQVGTKRVYKFLYFLLTRRHVVRGTSSSVVSSLVWKEIVQVHKVLDVRRVSAQVDWDGGVQVYNENIGMVFLTRHALERYWQYVCVLPSQLIPSISEVFARAQPESPSHHHRMKRLLRHDVVEVDYLECQTPSVRFVVSKEGERMVITVEQVM